MSTTTNCQSVGWLSSLRWTPQWMHKLLLLLLPSPVLSDITFLTSQLLYHGIQEGRFDVVADVRTASEYARGHIPNVTTLLENLSRYNPNDDDKNKWATPADLAGCEHCHIAVYCKTGGRAAVALDILDAAGFEHLYNGMGVDPWVAAGYSLVPGDDSVVPECTVGDHENDETCPTRRTDAPSVAPSVGIEFWADGFVPKKEIPLEGEEDTAKASLKMFDNFYGSWETERGGLGRRRRLPTGDQQQVPMLRKQRALRGSRRRP